MSVEVRVYRGTKMAPDKQRSEKIVGEAPIVTAITRQDLLDLNAELLSSIKDVTRTANAAMELGLALQDENKSLQQADHQLHLKVAALEAQSRAANLKFCGFPETSDFNNNLTSSLAMWLASILKLEDRVNPTVLNAYRLGPQVAAYPNFPRDVVAQFLYPRSRNAILKRARTGGIMKYEDHTIQVLLDLGPNILAKRHTLKLVTEILRGNNIRFRWSPLSDILVFKDGK